MRMMCQEKKPRVSAEIKDQNRLFSRSPQAGRGRWNALSLDTPQPREGGRGSGGSFNDVTFRAKAIVWK
jgi:hypothetical protein